ncbi:MAG: AAA family ATPase [Bacteroidales bacterium]|nr:AAA family ATPase [Bacteroidales bacterium]
MEINKLDNLNIHEFSNEILSDKDFRYAKAADAWKEWNNMEISKEKVSELLSMPYETLCNSDDPETILIREAIFKAVSYFDTKSKNKQLLNEYPDKRAIAQTGIRQNDWVTRLLKYKLDKNDLTPGVRNLINYLNNPRAFFPILSDIHMEKINNYFIGEKAKEKFSVDRFAPIMLDYFNGAFECENPENFTAALTKIIYRLRYKWDPEPAETIKGLFAHDSDYRWKESFLEDIGDGKGCLWWHTLPVRFEKEIMAQLSRIIDDGESFDFYYITNNKAEYKARVIDFATDGNYTTKYAIWEQENETLAEKKKAIAWGNKEFSKYSDGTHTAAIVFLVDNFIKLANPIPLENVVRYKNMGYSIRGGLAAFTNILNENIKIMQANYNQEITEIIELFSSEKNLILQGAPGTGKTYNTATIAVGLIEGVDGDFSNHDTIMKRYQTLIDNKQIAFSTFHQSMDYEDFIEGLRPKIVDKQVVYEIHDGRFKTICKLADKDPDNKYVLIIDEINRGNVSKIFGELISLIEKDKRNSPQSAHQLSLYLTYSGDEFGVPENVYILGTMNTTDRSTGTLDYALRRRFVFKTLKANEQVVNAQEKHIADIAKPLFNEINQFIKDNNIADMDIEDLKIGHSYFLAESEQQLKNNIKFKVIPLLKEYINDGILRNQNGQKSDIFLRWSELKCGNNDDDTQSN